MNTYEVKPWGGNPITVQAETADKAKRIACRILGRTPSNPLTGVRGMKARKVVNHEKV